MILSLPNPMSLNFIIFTQFLDMYGQYMSMLYVYGNSNMLKKTSTFVIT